MDRAVEEAERRQLEEARERSIRETRGTAAEVGTHLAAPESEATSSRSRSRERREQRRRDDESREERRERRETRRRLEALEAQSRASEAAASAAVTAPVASLTTENLAAARLSPPTTSPRHPSAVEARQRERQIAPQTSLRSLMSSSESGTGTGDSMEAEQILQQLIEDGLLDGIDPDNLNQAQQDALSERIAEAYRQIRHNRREQSSRLSPNDRTRRENGRSSDRSRVRERQQEAERRHHQRSHSAQGSTSSASRQAGISDGRRLPVSKTRLQNGEATSTAHRRRASEHERRQTSPARQSHRTNSEDVHNQATRSATDISERPRTSDSSRATRIRHPSDTRRPSADPEHIPSVTERWRRVAQGDHVRSHSGQLPNSENPALLSPENGTELASAGTPSPRSVHAILVTDPSATSSSASLQPTAAPIHTPLTTSTQRQSDLSRHSAHYPPGPSITCTACSRPDIQYDVHKHCSICSSDICLRCYRTIQSSTLGCTSNSVAESASHLSAPTSHPSTRSHTFTSRKYLRPDGIEITTSSKIPNSNINGHPEHEPASRFLEGKFCDLCHAFANTCYWSCDICNKGDWGFCNSCINSHHCCTHPLLPMAHKSYAPKTPTLHQGANPDSGVITLTPSNLHADVLTTQSRSRPSTSGSSATPPTDYVPLTFTTNCDICTSPIPPSHTRFHCPGHPSPSSDPNPSTATTTTNNSSPTLGDYDICTPCYLSLIKLRKLRKEDGPNGWRRCPQGHRMIVVGFEECPEGQRRVVVNDLVGGHSLRDIDIAGSGPRPGQWTWFEPEDGDASANRNTSTGAGVGVGTVRRQTRTSRLRHLSPPSSPSSSSTAPSKFPPDGGSGLRVLAIYPWFPEEGESGAGELLFPRWAEIREVEDVNGEWWAGVYGGVAGVFPGVCAEVIR